MGVDIAVLSPFKLQPGSLMYSPVESTVRGTESVHSAKGGASCFQYLSLQVQAPLTVLVADGREPSCEGSRVCTHTFTLAASLASDDALQVR